MNILKMIFILFLVVGLSSAAFAADPALISVPYTKQTSFKCGDKEIKIPPYFPDMDSTTEKNFSLTAYEKDCSKDNFEITLGVGDHCGGQNLCLRASFSSVFLGKNIYDNLYAAFSVYTKEIELANDETGFYAPTQLTCPSSWYQFQS